MGRVIDLLAICGGGVRSQLRQLRVLMQKNILLWRREVKWVILMLLWSLIISALVWVGFGLQLTDSRTILDSTASTARNFSSTLPKCNHVPGCTTMLYAPTGDKYYKIMKSLSTLNGLSISESPTDNSTGYDIIAFENKFQLIQFISTIKNFTKFSSAIVFDDNGNRPVLSAGPLYTVYRGSFWGEILFQTPSINLENIQLAVDRAIIHADTGRDYNLQVSVLPIIDIKNNKKEHWRRNDFNWAVLFAWIGLPFLIVLSTCVHAASVISQLNDDRQKEIRLGLKMAGLENFPYLFALLLEQNILAIFTSLIITAGGFIGRLEFFINSPFLLVWIIIWLTSSAAASFSLVLGTIFHRPAINNALLIFFYLGFISISMFAANPDSAPLFFSSPIVSTIDVFIFPTNLGSLIAHIGIRALHESSFDVYRNNSMPGYHWADLWDARLTPDQVFNKWNYVFPPVWNLVGLALCSVSGLLLAWYLDTAFAGETGISEGPLFIFRASFWGLSEPGPLVETTQYEEDRLNSVLFDLDPDIEREHENTIQSMNAGPNSSVVLSVMKLSKTFSARFGGSRGDHRALDTVSFNVQKGSVLGLLGHNGSGKTTLIKILTGVLAPSFGDALVAGNSIRRRMGAVRRSVGVCPQTDVCFNSLTPRENLKLFAILKGIPSDQHDEAVRSALSEVRLGHEADSLVSTLSPGAKRRLSVAIACLGTPNLVFLDEPTSSLDPISCKEIWRAVERMKRNCAIVVTTHSMLEAEALSDKIAVLALGRLRAVGSPQHLKERFGSSHQISVSLRAGQSDAVKDELIKIAPDAQFEDISETGLSFSVFQATTEKMTQIIAWLEHQSYTGPSSSSSSSLSSGVVKGFEVHQSTLEQVFVRLTHGTSKRANRRESSSSV